MKARLYEQDAQREFLIDYIRGHEPFWNCELLLMHRLVCRATSLIHISEIKILLNLPSTILVLIFVNVNTLIMLMFIFRTGLWATHMVLAGDLVPVGTTLVTPGLYQWGRKGQLGYISGHQTFWMLGQIHDFTSIRGLDYFAYWKKKKKNTSTITHICILLYVLFAQKHVSNVTYETDSFVS